MSNLSTGAQRVYDAMQILPCPFCGASASVEEIPLDALGVQFSVGCDSPSEDSCMGYQSFQQFNTRKAAIAAWNKRAPK